MNFDDLIGKQYKEGGRGPGRYDCWGICMEASKRIGIKLPEEDEIIRKSFIKQERPKLGDIVSIRVMSAEHGHVGIMENSTMLLTVHSTGRRGVHSMKITHPWIKDRIEGFYRYAG